jgi:molecular chaperone Hsp33
MSSRWRKWITEPGHTRIVALEGTTLARELVAIQALAPVAQPGLADAVVGALLIASSHKSNEAINLNAKGSALFRQAIVDASPEGRARGFLITNEELLRSTWGTGVLSILYTKNFEGKHPYTGMVPITDGTLETAINEYYRDSEQLTSRVGFDVGLRDGKLVARGVLIQAMGGATDEERRVIDALRAEDLRALAVDADAPDFAARAGRLLGDVTLKETETLPLTSFCTCSVERIERALLLTGEADTRDALGQDPHLSITCDFCRREYTVTADRITTLFSRDPSHLQ